MSKKDNFFIGWLGNTSDDHKKSIKRVLIPIFIAIPLVIFAIVFFTKPFGTGSFELGNVKEFTGVYYEDPFPVLLLDEGQLENGSSTSALLVGFGKNGAKTFLKMAEEKEGKLSGKRLTIQGTLIYGDGKTLIELTKKEKSVINVMKPEIDIDQKPRLNKVELKGEIIDPKCWFGVMKPAEGKVHKSCAIRCISGGIPPVLKVDNNGDWEYYIIKNVNGEDINQEVLEFIAEDVVANGESYTMNGWKVLRVDSEGIKYVE
jgi:hypothetical protein